MSCECGCVNGSDNIQINSKEVTEVIPTGSGMFDRIMSAIREQLNTQFKENRIVGPQYAEVYASALTSAMEQAVGFVLQRYKVMADLELSKAQLEIAKQQLENEKKNEKLIEAQIRKLNAETELLGQRIQSELAQVDGSHVKPDSVLGKQILLYQRQADGFLNDNIQKVAKLYADIYSTMLATDQVVDPSAAGFDAASMKYAMTKLAETLD